MICMDYPMSRSHWYNISLHKLLEIFVICLKILSPTHFLKWHIWDCEQRTSLWTLMTNTTSFLLCFFVFDKTESEVQAHQMWFVARIENRLKYLKQTASHGKDPPDHLQGLTGVRQEGQPAEGKSHQHSCTNSHQQEKPTRRGSHRYAGVIAQQKPYGYAARTKKQTTVDEMRTFLVNQTHSHKNLSPTAHSYVFSLQKDCPSTWIIEF